MIVVVADEYLDRGQVFHFGVHHSSLIPPQSESWGYLVIRCDSITLSIHYLSLAIV